MTHNSTTQMRHERTRAASGTRQRSSFNQPQQHDDPINVLPAAGCRAGPAPTSATALGHGDRAPPAVVRRWHGPADDGREWTTGQHPFLCSLYSLDGGQHCVSTPSFDRFDRVLAASTVSAFRFVSLMALCPFFKELGRVHPFL